MPGNATEACTFPSSALNTLPPSLHMLRTILLQTILWGAYYIAFFHPTSLEPSFTLENMLNVKAPGCIVSFLVASSADVDHWPPLLDLSRTFEFFSYRFIIFSGLTYGLTWNCYQVETTVFFFFSFAKQDAIKFKFHFSDNKRCFLCWAQFFNNGGTDSFITVN